eukprot:TRINITY_DN2441_c0_g1_i1.p1 TRINITY_DN2441_c0_g1~~TRINITY_DN2441_c0_g1_i1.p1  ORF type:complete len:131 (-),score=25.83 TRINITY_DN2441_c0_g1_i1:405-797(-)
MERPSHDSEKNVDGGYLEDDTLEQGITHVASPVIWRDDFEAYKEEEEVRFEEQDPPLAQPQIMQPFPSDQTDWKKVLYNLLVQNHNHPSKENPIYPIEVEVAGETKKGFAINAGNVDPRKFLAELYATNK